MVRPSAIPADLPVQDGANPCFGAERFLLDDQKKNYLIYHSTAAKTKVSQPDEAAVMTVQTISKKRCSLVSCSSLQFLVIRFNSPPQTITDIGNG